MHYSNLFQSFLFYNSSVALVRHSQASSDVQYGFLCILYIAIIAGKDYDNYPDN